MKQIKYILLIVLITSLESCKFSKNESNYFQCYQCLINDFPEAINIFESLDSILIENKFVNPSNAESYYEAFKAVEKKDISINPYIIWKKKTHPMEFFSPNSFLIINNCIFENDNGLNHSKLKQYEEIVEIFISHEEVLMENMILEDLASNINKDELDRFFFFYLFWFNVIKSYYAPAE